MLNALILHPSNVPQVESLYTIQRQSTNLPQPSYLDSYLDYLDLRDRNRSFDDLAAWSMSEAALDTGQNSTRVWPAMVSVNYSDALGIHPYLGRFFHRSDEHGFNSAPYIVLTYDYWHSHFLHDWGVVGRTVRLNKYPFTILGVAPREFQGSLLIFQADFYTPIVNREQVAGWSALNERGNRSLSW